MKCRYAHTPDGKVLIPECWNVVMSQDISDCTCANNPHLVYIEYLKREGKIQEANDYYDIYKEQRRFNSKDE